MEDKIREEQLVDIVEVKDNAQDYFTKNRSMILGIVGLIFVLAAAFVIYKYFIQEPKEKQASVAIFKAEQQFARDSFALALENPGGGFESLLDVIENYNGTKTANLAKLYAGISYLNLGRYDDAIEYLDAHSAGGTYGPILKNGNLADAYSEKGEMDKAISFYSKATSSGEDALLTPYYLYKLGLLAKRNGDNSKALSSFNKIKDAYPDSEEAKKVGRLIAIVSNSSFSFGENPVKHISCSLFTVLLEVEAEWLYTILQASASDIASIASSDKFVLDLSILVTLSPAMVSLSLVK